MTGSSGSKTIEEPMLLVSNVRSLREENEVSKTKGKRQPLREAKNTANTKLMVGNALSESDDNSDSNTGEESNLSDILTKQINLADISNHLDTLYL